MSDLPDSHFNFENNDETNSSNSNIENDEYDFIGYPFNYRTNPEIEELNQNDSHIYNNSISSSNSNISTRQITFPQREMFSVFTQKKRGRKKVDIKNNKSHGKGEEDNIIRKIQVSYINFVIDFVNIICKEIGRSDLHFIPLDYDFKRIVNKMHREMLKSNTIEKIIKSKVSPKFKTKHENENEKICEKIKKENIYILLNILNKNFFFFFDKIYYRNSQKINLMEFGLEDIEIDLKNIELFQDLLNKNKKDIHFEEYKKKIIHFVKKNFLPKERKDIFKCNY